VNLSYTLESGRRATLRLTAAASLLASLVAAPLGASAQPVGTELPPAQVAALKQKLGSRLQGLSALEGVRTTPIPGLLEVRVAGHILYTDPNGEYLIDGQMIETRTQRNLTEERVDEINKIDFATLPLKDAVVWKTGTGKRRLVVFSDPNCGYCKRLERTFNNMKDITVYTFMIGILGEDSKKKADTIWCMKDRTQAWRDWMLNDESPFRLMGMCGGTPLQRNMALAQRLRVNGTPAMFFEDGTRLASAAPQDVIEKRLAKAAAARP